MRDPDGWTFSEKTKPQKILTFLGEIFPEAFQYFSDNASRCQSTTDRYPVQLLAMNNRKLSNPKVLRPTGADFKTHMKDGGKGRLLKTIFLGESNAVFKCMQHLPI